MKLTIRVLGIPSVVERVVAGHVRDEASLDSLASLNLTVAIDTPA
jgi:hypothetical protein